MPAWPEPHPPWNGPPPERLASFGHGQLASQTEERSRYGVVAPLMRLLYLSAPYLLLLGSNIERRKGGRMGRLGEQTGKSKKGKAQIRCCRRTPESRRKS